MRSTASLVIHVGTAHLRDAPMLELRFIEPSAQHVFLDASPQQLLEDRELSESILELRWSKATWLDCLTRVLLILRDESAALERPADSLDVAASQLAELLLSSHYTVIVWGEDELADELDGLIVQRLLELARQVSRTSRCSLLSLAQDPGRVTAKDCVLWLTNRTTPLRYVDSVWQKELVHHHRLEQWQAAFDWILCIRNLPSDRPLPELRFDLILDAHCNVDSAHAERTVPVQAVGLDAPGHLLRSDHGLAAFIAGSNAQPSSPFPAADELLAQLHKILNQ